MNAAARLVLNLRSRDHITPALMQLHWLPIEARIQYKLSCLVHSVRAGKSPEYLGQLLQPVSSISTRRATLRSASSDDLYVPRSRLKFGERAFAIAAPKAWNDLPPNVRCLDNTDTFKKNLKTFLFRKFHPTD